MYRLYYLADNLNTAEETQETLLSHTHQGRNLHVLANNDTELAQHHLKSATPLERLDIVHCGKQGLFIGLCSGLLISVFTIIYGTLEGSQLTLIPLAIALTTALFGGWMGGLVGISRENHRISHFHSAINQGKCPLMIDLPESLIRDTRKLLSNNTHLESAGEDKGFAWA